MATTWKNSRFTSSVRSDFHKVDNLSITVHALPMNLYGLLPPISQTIQVRHIGHSLRCKDELISEVRQWAPPYEHNSVNRPVNTYIPQICVNTMHRLEVLPSKMVGSNGWQQKAKGIHAVSTLEDSPNARAIEKNHKRYSIILESKWINPHMTI